jgi:osmotically inducible protein OsmC
MLVRTGNAVWEGDLKEGKGSVTFGGEAFPYSFTSRFAEGKGTNPEELIGAAHAGCFSMALSGALAQAGHAPKKVSTTARVHLEKVGEGFRITVIDLETEASVQGMDERAFQEIAEKAKKGCPVSQALAGVDIKLTARLSG